MCTRLYANEQLANEKPRNCHMTEASLGDDFDINSLRLTRFDLNIMAQSNPTPMGRRARGVVKIEKISTEADRQLKALAKKQIEVETTLSKELLKRKTFTTPVVFEIPEIVGSLSLKEFQRKTSLEQRIDELRAYRLSREEIDMIIEHEHEEKFEQPVLKKTNYGVDPEITRIRIEAIYEKMRKQDEELNKKDKFIGKRELTRHEMELELAIASRNKEAMQLNAMLVDTKLRNTTKVDSELNSVLLDIESRSRQNKDSHEMMSFEAEDDIHYLNKDNILKENVDCEFIGPLPKAEYLSNDTRNFYEANDCNLSKRDTLNDGKLGTLDCRHMAFESTTYSNSVTNTVQNMETGTPDGLVNQCAADLQKTIVLGSEQSIPEETIKRYRMSIDEIRQLPRFETYEVGEPYRALYLRNLANTVTDEDLAALFVRFQRPDCVRIVFKLLKGRMRGQAFVTFPDTETATEALKLVNGFDFKGKPIVIQYARKH